MGGKQIRQDRVFERAKERGLDPHYAKYGKECGCAAGDDPRRGGQHQRDLTELDQPDQPSLVVLVGELSGRRRAQKERQDE